MLTRGRSGRSSDGSRRADTVGAVTGGAGAGAGAGAGGGRNKGASLVLGDCSTPAAKWYLQGSVPYSAPVQPPPQTCADGACPACTTVAGCDKEKCHWDTNFPRCDWPPVPPPPPPRPLLVTHSNVGGYCLKLDDTQKAPCAAGADAKAGLVCNTVATFSWAAAAAAVARGNVTGKASVGHLTNTAQCSPTACLLPGSGIAPVMGECSESGEWSMVPVAPVAV